MRAIRAILPLTQFALLFLSVVGMFSRSFYFAEIVSHFSVQYAVLSALLALAFVWRRPWLKWIALSSIVMFINLLPVSDLYFKDQSALSIDQSFDLVSFNVLNENSNKSSVLSYLDQKDADILVILEYTPEWDSVLNTLKAKYVSVETVPLKGHFGIAVFSKFPTHFETKFYAMDEVPSIEANFEFGGDSICLLATHPTPPVTPFDWEARNFQFEAIIKERIGFTQQNFILVGDLNTTSFSRSFKDLRETTFTRDSRLGFGIQPTWPTWNKLFYISLDHCLVSDQIVVKNRERGPFLESDHLPLELELSLKKKI